VLALQNQDAVGLWDCRNMPLFRSGQQEEETRQNGKTSSRTAHGEKSSGDF
jgi:hypothetical protein